MTRLHSASPWRYNGNTRKLNYTGKVVGDSINFKTGEGDRAREFTAKRATELKTPISFKMGRRSSGAPAIYSRK